MKSTIFVLIFFAFNLFADDSVPSLPVKEGVQLYRNKSKTYLAINFLNFKEWHTYWKNPGDAGLSIKNQFLLNNKEIKLAELEWPTPRRFIENQTQWAYGYIDGYSIFFELSKNDLSKILNKKITLKSSWLVCKHVCVPGEKSSEIIITESKVENNSKDALEDLSELELNNRFMNLPLEEKIPDYLTINLFQGENPNTLIISYKIEGSTDLSQYNNSNILFNFPSPPFDITHEVISTDGSNINGKFDVNWDGEYSTPKEDFPINGKFKKAHRLKFLFVDPKTKKTIAIEKEFKDITKGKAPIISELRLGNGENQEKKSLNLTTSQIKKENSSLIYYLMLAFIGGFILNFMPCVLPVISLKLFGLIKYQNESRIKIIKHNLFYTLGILSTFTILASIIIFLKNLNSNVGWGFQLQSPTFISIMVIVLFVFSLNLFSLFEFVTPFGKHLGNVKTEENFIGDFFNGVLATILSTPCSAPFLGTALTFAFTSPSLVIILVFLTIGLGLATPFIITGIFPKTVSFLPRPGKWMNSLKKFLGITLLLTILWLLDVYNTLVDGSSHLIKLSTVLIIIFSGFLLFKRNRTLRYISFLISLFLFINLSSTTIISSNEEITSLIRDKKSNGLNYEAWSYEKMDEYKTNHQLVFLDFTAKWCFTCKVNEKLVLDTKDFSDLVNENNIKLLIGDWTKKDEIIGKFLKENGLVGVPAYFIIKRDGTMINLGETISIQKIKENLN